MKKNKPFSFETSLSILNQLGRGLYRNFITILGEAISNSWDADATNVWIETQGNNLIIKDDGVGMNANDFQDKFLLIGYSKRGGDKPSVSKNNRPFIGRKGIGKLAFLSCAEEINIQTKMEGHGYVGGAINNLGLDKAITHNVRPDEYSLEEVNENIFTKYKQDHKHGTIIYFKTLNEGVKNTEDFLRKSIALHFRFSLLDKNFNIYLNKKKITTNDLKGLIEKTQFVWKINNHEDDELCNKIHAKALEKGVLNLPNHSVTGFIASVKIPKDLNIYGTGEKIGVDFFVNGRLRETNTLLRGTKAFPTQYIASYLYGQIHYNEIDSKDEDPFTTSREGVKPENADYKKLISDFIPVLNEMSNEWDKWRREHKYDGDPENPILPKYQRRIEESKNARSKDYQKKIDSTSLDPSIKQRLKDALRDQSHFNTQIYQDLFILENLIREYLKARGIESFSAVKRKFSNTKAIKCTDEAHELHKPNRAAKEQGNHLQGNIIKDDNDLNYFDLTCLSILLDLDANRKPHLQTMEANAKEIIPVRDAVMHTNEITKKVKDWDKIENIIDLIDGMIKQ